jgi:hypothetical protein
MRVFYKSEYIVYVIIMPTVHTVDVLGVGLVVHGADVKCVLVSILRPGSQQQLATPFLNESADVNQLVFNTHACATGDVSGLNAPLDND